MSITLANGSTIKTLLEAMDKQIKSSLTPEQALPLESMIQTIMVLWGSSPDSTVPGGLAESKPGKRVEKSDYDPDWAYSKKFIYFLRKEQRFLHLREVADMVASVEGLGAEAAAKLSPKISTSIGGLKKNLVKYQVGNQNRNTFWGKKEWLESPNQPKEEYKGNENYLSTHRDKHDSLDF